MASYIVPFVAVRGALPNKSYTCHTSPSHTTHGYVIFTDVPFLPRTRIQPVYAMRRLTGQSLAGVATAAYSYGINTGILVFLYALLSLDLRLNPVP